MLHTFGMFLVGLGFGIQILGQTCLRKPGVTIWTPMSMWEASKHLYSPGPALLKIGFAVVLIGMFAWFLAAFLPTT